MALKASICQAQGNLEQAAKFLTEINEQTPHQLAFGIRIDQLKLERNYSELIRLLQVRLAQFHFDSELDRATDQVVLALTQRLAGSGWGKDCRRTGT